MRRAKGHVSCSENFELSIDKLPNDPSYPSGLWGLAMMAAENAWDLTTGSREVIVAVIDTGINQAHPDLKANVWVNSGEIANNGRDDDVNGYVDDSYGVNAITRVGNGVDDNGHGSHVAGTIGASGDNAEGVVGLNWNVRVMGLKFLSSSGSGSTANAIRAVEYVIDAKKRGHNVVAINASWGSSAFSEALLQSIKKASAAGILFVASAGNSSRNTDTNPSYPAAFSAENIISVASIDRLGELSYFSNYGSKTVHIAAPGSSILSTVLTNRYAYLSGTSMASPHVTGLAALAYAACPTLTMAQVKALILSNGVKSAALATKTSTGSIANAAGAVLAAASLCGMPTPSPTPTPDPKATVTPAPTVIATMTPTPTPTATSTPIPTGAYLLAEPEVIPAGSSMTLKISTGNTTPSAVSLRYTFKDTSGATHSCVGATIVSLPKGTRTVTIPLSKEALHFPTVNISFSTLKGTYSTRVSQTNTTSTLIPNSKAALLCRWLTSQSIL
jgi:subtilisin family serine protease